jgi:hypothetical protein
MRRNVISLVALDLILRTVCAGVPPMTLVLEIARVNRRDRAAHPSSFRIPPHMIADLESLAHDNPWIKNRPPDVEEPDEV